MNKLIIPLLSIVSASSALFAQSYSLTSTYLYIYVDAEDDSAIEDYLEYDADLDDAPGLSLEWRTAPIDGMSYGLEYIYFGTKADVSGILDSDDALVMNVLTDGTEFIDGNPAEVKEEYTVHGALFNLAYNIELSDESIAYIGAGVGFSHFNQEFSASTVGAKYTYDDSDTVFTYQFKAGVRYALNDAWAVNGGLRYIGFGDPEFSYGDVDLSGDLSALAIELGLSYTF
ncbi:outer membrane beta-barrel protein [Opitutales bacterium]|nr:outer membrane beta-barrel protein [Opitutales bacterium]